MTGEERRQSIRMGLALPAQVKGFNEDGTTWDETTTTDDVSEGGCSFTLARRVELGQVLLLALPFPKRLRQHDANDASYRVYSLVRGLSYRPDHARVGVMFFGKFPPRGFAERPGARYLFASDPPVVEASPPSDPVPTPTPTPTPPPGGPVSFFPSFEEETSERRASPRFDRLVDFVVQQVDEWGTVLQEELTVADNLSKGGAHLLTTLEFMKGDQVLLQQPGGDFSTRATVCEVAKGEDGLRRLHLKFLDREAPDRLLRP